jgi:hypothetical protein
MTFSDTSGSEVGHLVGVDIAGNHEMDEEHERGRWYEPKVFDKGMDDKGIVKDQATAGSAGACTLVYIFGGESQYQKWMGGRIFWKRGRMVVVGFCAVLAVLQKGSGCAGDWKCLYPLCLHLMAWA